MKRGQKPSPAAHLIKQLLTLFPNTPTLTLAKKAYSLHPELWKDLENTRSKVNLCFHDMEEEMTRTKNDLGDHRMRVLEDAERIGGMKVQLDHLQQENTRLKDSLREALELLESHNINQFKLWRT